MKHAGLLLCVLLTPLAAQNRVAPPARIMEFTAQPESIQPGQTVTLRWATENPNAVTIEPGLGRAAARGQRRVKPSATTTYTLTVTGPNNTTLTRTVTVSVAGAAANPAVSSAKLNPLDVRLPDGHPDFSGVYNFAGVQGAVAPELKPGAEKYRIVRGGPNDAKGRTTLGTDCKPLGVPQSFVTPYPFQIVHKPNLLVMIFEYPSIFRMIPTDGRPHPPDPDPTWMGNSVARWEGDTLVVDTIGFNEKTEVSGFMHSEALHVVERYTRIEDGSLNYEVTVEDPNVWVAPWVMPPRVFRYRPEAEMIDEFVCEGSKDYDKLFGK